MSIVVIHTPISAEVVMPRNLSMTWGTPALRLTSDSANTLQVEVDGFVVDA